MKFIIIAAVLLVCFMKNAYLGAAATIVALIYILVSNRAFFLAKKANKFINEGDNEKALGIYKKAYETGNASAGITTTYAIMLLRSGDPETASSVLNAISAEPKYKDDERKKAKLFRTLAYYKMGQTEEAVLDAEELFEDYKNTLSYGLYCYLKLALGEDPKKILPVCIEAYEYNSDDRDIADNLLYAYILNEEYDKAKELSDDMLLKYTSFTEAYYHSALLYHKTGDDKKAAELLKKISENCTRTYLTTVSEEDIKELLSKTERKSI